jgi:hypothetical protein
MVTDLTCRRVATDRLRGSKTIPSPEQVREMAAEIRES